MQITHSDSELARSCDVHPGALKSKFDMQRQGRHAQKYLTGHKDNLDSSFCDSVESHSQPALTDGLTVTATAGWKRAAVLQQHSAADKQQQVCTCCAAACNASG